MRTLTEGRGIASGIAESRKRGSWFLYFLMFVCFLFIGILIFCYVVTRQANPILVDTNGKPVAEGSATSHR